MTASRLEPLLEGNILIGDFGAAARGLTAAEIIGGSGVTFNFIAAASGSASAHATAACRSRTFSAAT